MGLIPYGERKSRKMNLEPQGCSICGSGEALPLLEILSSRMVRILHGAGSVEWAGGEVDLPQPAERLERPCLGKT